ncbi:LysE family translocator [Bacillus atrophaeus]|uniref:LysE family translocator n=1 Tax=Bacillus atrophaeus TaxID=1452 RepID=UPI002DBC38AD|nr:LysE family translocator [Bacillus atrophaeus]MEC1900210.1 LysE family translocator [Bacillus atrophaeus]MEC2397203.1 LysE family translocator [Bacillus atrophaeus]MED4435814.1 LysE family translocator [Bacillus atrophaeus]MED4565454.1 LysE family translocator [Bacillus atrophaeus]MED4575685.1 LysE family translocator [Bacillus atrophaeus]
MNIFFSYIILGLSLSAPVGPVNAAQIDKGIKNGFWHAWVFGLGAMAADGLYMILIYFGLSQFLTAPFVKTFLWLFGFFVLTYTGIETLKNVREAMNVRSSKGKATFRKTFTSGFFISLSNPLSILFWLGIYGSILAKTAEAYSMNQLLLYSSGIIIGILIWDFCMALLAGAFRSLLNEKFLRGLTAIAGVSLIIFGVYFGYQGVKELLG